MKREEGEEGGKVIGGGEGDRTLDPQLAKLVLSQLSYAPSRKSIL